MKKFIAIAALCAICCALGACGRRNNAPANTNPTTAPTTAPTTQPGATITMPTLETNIPDPEVDTSMTEDATGESTEDSITERARKSIVK